MSEQKSLNHPDGLRILFFTEMWERFSYYGMRALLVLYLVNNLDYERSDALEIYAIYTFLVYLSPIVGGYIADKWLGTRLAIVVGGIIMVFGHFAMAFPLLLEFALGLIIAGNGFFKPNISILVGSFYTQADTRRDAAYTYYYMGINLGAFLAPFVCGTLGEKIGWHFGFSAAGIGMVLGLVVFLKGYQKVTQSMVPGSKLNTDVSTMDSHDWIKVSIVSLAVVFLVSSGVIMWSILTPFWTELEPLSQLGYGAAVLIGAVGLKKSLGQKNSISKDGGTLQSFTKQERDQILAILAMSFFVIFFWMGFEQAGGTMNLFADQQTDRIVYGWEMPASYFQSINPLAILLLAPLFSIFWFRFDRSRFALIAPVKLALGILIMGLGFIVLAIGAEHAEKIGKVSPFWLVGAYVLHTIGELCISPIGMSLVTKLSPIRIVSIMMGLWLTTIGIANYFAGILENYLMQFEVPIYWFLVISSFSAGLLLLVMSPLIKRMMHGVR